MSDQIKKDRYVAAFFLQDPSILSTEFVEYSDELREDPGVRWYCAFDNFTEPMRKADLLMLVARPGNAKTTLSVAMAREMARAAMRGEPGFDENEVILYASVEQTAEDAELIIQASKQYTTTDYVRGNVPKSVIIKNMASRAQLPLWITGRSRRFFGVDQPQLDIEAIFSCIRVMKQDYGKIPAVIFLDYLQYIPSSKLGYNARQSDITMSVIRECKDLAGTVGVPIVITAQARREVDDTKDKLPGMRDVQWASLAEQTVDRMYSFTRPILSASPDQKLYPIGDRAYDINHSLLIVKHPKGRLEKAGGLHAMRFWPETLQLGLAEANIDINSNDAYKTIPKDKTYVPWTKDQAGNVPF